jgi:hypothetical protein
MCHIDKLWAISCMRGNTTGHCYSYGDYKSIYARIQMRTFESSQMHLEILTKI